MAETIKIGGELESTATGGVVAAATAIEDKAKGKKQAQINAEIDAHLAAHDSAINGLDGQNYLTLVATDADADIAAVFTRLSVTPATNTVYRIANWKHDAVTPYNVNYYSEYAATGTTPADLVPISVENKGIDDEPTAGSDNLVKSGGVQNELALGAVYDVSAKNPTAGPNNDGKWESLSALLSDANLSTLIPTSVRKGGMSIKFVHTSDNEYVQYRLMNDEWSINASDWAIYSDIILIENPEFIEVHLDADDRILWGIKADGTIYYGAGVPPQVVDYINGKITELGLSDVNAIKAFLSDYVGSDTTLQALITSINESIATKANAFETAAAIALKANKDNPELSGKISLDKEIGENDEVIEASVQHVDNPEFVDCLTDNNDKILLGIKNDGDFMFGAGVPTQIIKRINSVKYEDLTSKFIEGFWVDSSTDKVIVRTSTNAEYMILNVKAGEIYSFSVQDGNSMRGYNILTYDEYVFKKGLNSQGLKEFILEIPIDGKLAINNNKLLNKERYVRRIITEDDITNVHSSFKGGGVQSGVLDSTCDIANVSYNDYNHTVVECSAGDVFDVTASYTSSTQYSTYCFLDSNNKVLSKNYYKAPNTFVSKKLIVAPPSSAKLLINVARNTDFRIKKSDKDSINETVYNTITDYVTKHGSASPGDIFKVKCLSDVGLTYWTHPIADVYENGVYRLTAISIIHISGVTGFAVRDDNTSIFTVKMLQYTGGNDDHNSGAVKFFNGSLYVGHASGHGYTNNMYFYIFPNPNDLYSYIRHVVTLNEGETTTYCNMYYYNNYWYIFYRAATSIWSCIKTQDFVNTTVYRTYVERYHLFRNVKGHDNLLRVLTYRNGAYTPNDIKGYFLNLDDMKIYDGNDTLLGNFEDSRDVVANIEPLISTTTEYPYIRLYNMAVTPKESLRFIYQRSNGSQSNDTGKYYYYYDGNIIELGEIGNSMSLTSIFHSGGDICPYNNNVVVIGDPKHTALIKCVVDGTSVIKKSIIAESKQTIFRPMFILDTYGKFTYTDGLFDPTLVALWPADGKNIYINNIEINL